ncbi:LysR substrate-binding domain-containing protein [Noviherbaspirillum sp. CPCC 100848]|uniref:LysR substrate-binding domain-containing protein n=1 Tax=Noviherbaspirillum album TaxID=3080276 RepID=A0ABU6JBC9_9BURK|nr:LysR substrate-binding domain-containing protein [Noviherbaspirillum sp. CPCC 100848]MEC4720949.1 LysR substrate-binding domain-containing protein [Noviherbaspirillum sp. CPCC 100848]
MLNLNDLHYFVRVVDHGGFAAASRRLGIPKSTLAKRVSELESELKVRLIQRSSRRFTVTELGQEFYRHAMAMVIEAEAAEDVVRGRLAEPSGMVRITASIPTAQNALRKPLVELAREFPKIHIALHASDRFVDVVQEGFDIAVRDHFATLPDSGLVQRRIGADDIHLVASPEYVARRGTAIHPSDLAMHDGLMVHGAGSTWRLRNEQKEEIEVRPVAVMSADESSFLLDAACAGLGVACLPWRLCAAALRDGRLVRVLNDWTAGSVTTTLLMPHRRGQLPSVRIVADRIADYLNMLEE